MRATTDWAITNEVSTDSVMLSDPARPHLYLQIKEGEVYFGEQVPGPSKSAIWQLIPVSDGSGYFHLVDAYFPGHGLMLGKQTDQGDVSFHTKIGPIGSNPEAMWFVDQACVRDARSIHLGYPSTAATDLFYNEVSPVDAPRGTYFCATGFGEKSRGPGPCGYAGIQRKADGSRIAIFSVWHRMMDEASPDPNALAVTSYASPNAEMTSFDGEDRASPFASRLPGTMAQARQSGLPSSPKRMVAIRF